jgi:hypothetical protein
VVLNEDGIIRCGDLPDYVVHNSVPQHQKVAEVSFPEGGVDLDGVLERIENGFIEQALLRSRGNKTVAAELLKLNRTTFIERLRKKGMLQTARRGTLPPEAVEVMTAANAPLTDNLAQPWDASAYVQRDAKKIAALSF